LPYAVQNFIHKESVLLTDKLGHWFIAKLSGLCIGMSVLVLERSVLVLVA